MIARRDDVTSTTTARLATVEKSGYKARRILALIGNRLKRLGQAGRTRSERFPGAQRAIIIREDPH